ncbi:MAG: helix-turn-helix transcriptional regulator [Bacteroidales bacterium]|nr:helix-turn-helix transcriptional regulator [Bacteroidales bacterium]
MKTLPILYTGQQFRVIRNQAGMSVNKLAEMSGVARTQIYNFEGGTLNITISTYRRLLNALAEFKAGQP